MVDIILKIMGESFMWKESGEGLHSMSALYLYFRDFVFSLSLATLCLQKLFFNKNLRNKVLLNR